MYLDLKKIVVPLSRMEIIYKHLRTAGAEGMEGMGLLLGAKTDDHFLISSAIIPRQKSYRTESGLMYYVDGEELHQVNVWAYKNKQSLIAQVHSHPGEAYHSSMDDEFAVITVVGGFSIVIPDFAAGPIDMGFWEVYQLMPNRTWNHLSKKSLQNLFEIVP